METKENDRLDAPPALLAKLFKGWSFHRWLANVRDGATDSALGDLVEGAD